VLTHGFSQLPRARQRDSARKVAAEIGASTMAVYTHFGGMNGLLEAIIAASFERFGAALASRRQPTTRWPTS
jgi:AcrR family transcriptional regulator